MRYPLIAILLWTSACAVQAQAGQDYLIVNGKLRAQWDERHANEQGPVAQANALLPGTVPLAGNGGLVEAEFQLSGPHWAANGVAQQRGMGTSAQQGAAWVNEFFLTHEIGSWQFSAGKKVTGWDVGYAFRPNDMVQQENRRALVSASNEGMPLMMAEYFDADQSLSLILVNPPNASDRQGLDERALAARYYRRWGSVDEHLFARLAERTGASVGAALAWVATDAVELHASARYLQRADSKAAPPLANHVFAANPWTATLAQNVTQVLVGSTWTNENQVSLLLEAWWDGTAPSTSQWQLWGARSRSLQSLAQQAIPVAAVAGNLAWQTEAFSVSNSLQQTNVYARASWTFEAWQPALDVLVHPVDGGYMATASLLWTGDRIKAQGGLRMYGGPSDSVMAQLPVRRQAYLCVTWSF